MMAPSSSLTAEERKIQRARDHDRRMRQLESTSVSTWSEMAQIATSVRDAEEWRLIKITVEDDGKRISRECYSFNEWLHNAAPKSRSHVYAGIGLLEELKNDVSAKDLRKIPQKSAKIMAVLPSRLRKSKTILQKATTLAPREFIADIRERAPDLHIEKLAPRKFDFTISQDKVIDAAIAMANVLEAGNLIAADAHVLSETDALEKICSDYMLKHQTEYEKIVEEANEGVTA